MISSSTRRRARVHVLCAAAAMVAAFVLPATASAGHSGTLSIETLQAGCQAKGVFLTPSATGGGFPANTVLDYTVVAYAGGLPISSPCDPARTQIPANASNSGTVVVQWNTVPGAEFYKIYRGAPGSPLLQAVRVPVQTPNGVIFVKEIPAASAFCPANKLNERQRCFAPDVGQGDAADTITRPDQANDTQALGHPDVRIVQTVDYAGNNSDAADDPRPTEPPTDPPAALRTDELHFPPGLNPNPTSAPACALTGAAPSLLGDPAVHGSKDPDEDTCLAASRVGYVQTISRIQNPDPNTVGIQPTVTTVTSGDIYIGTAKAGEPGRLYVVLRPACSAGSPVNAFDNPATPNTNERNPICTAITQSGTAEVEKEFLAAPASFVRRADGSYGIDVRTLEAATDEPISPVLHTVDPATGQQRQKTISIQIRQLTQYLYGFADQADTDASNDKAFINLPTNCGEKELTADKSTWNHTEPVRVGGAKFTPTNCEALPFAPKLTAVASGDTQEGGYPSLDVTVTQDATEAATTRVQVVLPTSLGTNLAGLQNTCTQEQFNADPNGCPAGSIVGNASASTAVLPGELTGNVYLIARPGNLPKLIVALRGAISLDLEGNIDIVGGNRIVNLFPSIPDVTLLSFKLHVNGGPSGLLRNVANLCVGAGNADAEFVAHSGKVHNVAAPLQVTGDCTPQPNAIGTPRRPRVRISMSRVRSGNPTMSVRVNRTRANLASQITTVRLLMPRGLRIRRNLRLEERLAVRTSKGLLPLGQLTVRTGRLTVANIPGGPSNLVRETFRRGSLRSFGAVRRRGAKQRVTFRVRVSTFGKRTFNYRVRVKPRS